MENSKAVKFVETTSDKMHLFETHTGKRMNKFTKEHSTLQQNEVRLFVKMLEHLAEMSEYDDRRKASIRLAKRVLQVMKDEDIALPYI